MNNHPAIVEVSRGNHVESSHLLDVVVCDADNKIVSSWGEADRLIYPRSSVKALQALLLIESGAAEAFGFEDYHLALACSSHNGEPVHTKTASDMLSRAGSNDRCLECGAQIPDSADDYVQLINSGKTPTAIHNNCSGKHAGFIAVAQHTGIPVEGYVGVEHRVQREVAAVMEEVIGTPHHDTNCGIDGCSIPTYLTPIDKLAGAFARFGVGKDPGEHRSRAMLRLRDACMQNPYFVAGKGRICTRLMEALPGRVFAKIGAEGVYTASLPELGLGIALKTRDGTMRAAEVAVCALVTELLELEEHEQQAMTEIANPTLRNRNNIAVGAIRLARN